MEYTFKINRQELQKSEEPDYKESSNGKPVVNRFQRIKNEYIQWSSARYIQNKINNMILAFWSLPVAVSFKLILSEHKKYGSICK